MRALNRQLRVATLPIAALSPHLASISASEMPMPGVPVSGAGAGVDGEAGARVTVSGVKADVELLLTKTKPKKITLVGSDGLEYPFLLKGREDLHLDERMMQASAPPPRRPAPRPPRPVPSRRHTCIAALLCCFRLCHLLHCASAPPRGCPRPTPRGA